MNFPKNCQAAITLGDVGQWQACEVEVFSDDYVPGSLPRSQLQLLGRRHKRDVRRQRVHRCGGAGKIGGGRVARLLSSVRAVVEELAIQAPLSPAHHRE